MSPIMLVFCDPRARGRCIDSLGPRATGGYGGLAHGSIPHVPPLSKNSGSPLPRGLGPLGKGQGYGFLLHSSLMLRTETGEVLGLAGQKLQSAG